MSRVLAAVDIGGRSFHSLMLLGRDENCTVCGTVVVGVAGRGVNADDLGAAVVCRQVLQCGPGCCSSSSTAW